MAHDERGRIQPGTRVRVDFTSVAADLEPTIYGRLLGRPSDVGDTFRVRIGKGVVVEVNPNCTAFRTIRETFDHEDL